MEFRGCGPRMLGMACDGRAGSVAEPTDRVCTMANPERDIACLDTSKPSPMTSVSSEDSVRIVLVEDDPLSRETLTEGLSKRGVNVQSFSDGSRPLESHHGSIECAVVVVGLHWNAQKMSRIDPLTELRRQGVHIPVVLMTGRTRRPNEYRPPHGAASEVACRSDHADELVDHLGTAIKALTGTTPIRSDRPLRYGKLLLCPDVHRAYWDDHDLDLTVSEYRILELLVSKKGRPVSYREIYDHRHYEGFVAGSGPSGYRPNVRSIVKRMRCKFRLCDPAFDAIKNLAGYGYRWLNV